MVSNFRTKAILTALLLIGALVVIFAQPITLGLDLAGGTYLRYSVANEIGKIDPGQRPAALESLMEILRSRVDNLGIKETTIRSQGEDEIIVELPGSSEAEAVGVEKVIESQGRLEFRLEAYDEPALGIDVAAQRTKLNEYLKTLPEEQRRNRRLDLRKLTEDLRAKQATYKWVPVSERSMKGKAGPGFDPKKAEVEWVLVKQDPAYDLTGGDLDNVYQGDDSGKPAVAFAVKAARAPMMGQFTENNQGRSIVVVLDGESESVAVIQSKITDHGQISGGRYGFSQEEVKHLMTVLKSGALPVKPALLSRSQIGPSLGEDSIRLGKLSSIVSLAIVALFMVFYYRLSGMIACFSLLINLGLLLAILVALQATLTLPGIAGIALTIGMAVDANILVHERMREERDKGKTVLQSVKLGFEKAFTTIVDSNLTTFIAGLILYYVGTGPIRGFAVTLMLGILTTLFSVLVGSKLLFHGLTESGAMKELKMLRWVPVTNVRFTRYMMPCIIASSIIIVLGMGLFFFLGPNKYGLDFTGGYKATMQFRELQNQGEIRKEVNEIYPGAEVVSVGGEKGRATVFQVKIKRIEGLDSQTASEPPQTASLTGAQQPAADASEAVLKEATPPPAHMTAETFKATLREKFGNRLVADPITDLKATQDTQRSQTQIEFRINFTSPVAKSLVERNAAFLQDASVEGQDPSASYLIKGVYPVVVTNDAIQALAITNLKRDLPRVPVDGREVLITESEPFTESDLIGPRVGSELRDKAIIALVLSLLATIIYVRIRFHGYRYGIAATVALAHDVLVTVAAIALANWLGIVQVEFDLTTVAVLLTIVGYSINDTIVIFDRVRENLPRMNKSLAEVIDISLNQTLSRTLLTSLTVFMTVLVMFGFNYGRGNALEAFSFAMIIGTITGVYSTVYIASPLVIWLAGRSKKTLEAAG